MDNLVIILIVAAILAGAIWYVLREKRRGKKCVGCPYAEGCSGGCNCK